MSKKRWEQMGAAGGIAFVVLQILSQALIQIGGTEPSFNASPQEIVDFFINRNPQLFAVGSLLSALSVIAFLWFLGVLWAVLRVHEGEPGWLSLVAFGSGLVGLATVLSAGSGWTLAVFRMGEGLEPQMARFLFDHGNFGFATFWVVLASFLLATGVVSIRDRALPLWLGWFGVIIAVAFLVARAFWAAPSGMVFTPYVLFWLWLIMASIVLIRRVDGKES